MPTVIPIDELEVSALPPCRKETVQLSVTADLGGQLAVHALIASGREAGPTLLVVAGVHGNEYEGMEAVRRVFAALDPAALRGVFVGIPVANPLAYAARTRATPGNADGLNLARVFPGNVDGTVTLRLAHHLLGLVERNVGPGDLFVDLHSGSADVAFATMVGFRDIVGVDQTAAEEAARHFGVPRLWRIPDSPGPFNAETARRGIPTIGTETTGRAGCDAVDVASYVAGLRNLMTYLEMQHGGTPVVRHKGPARPTRDVLAPAGGFFRAAVRLHDAVVEDAVLGEIVDLDGDVVVEVATPVRGEVWALRATPAVHPGEMIAMIAR
jgi:predicted deacylase